MENIEISKIVGFFATVAIVPLILSKIIGPLNTPQIISLVIFTSFIAGSLFYWQFRNAFAFIGIALLLAFNVLDLEHLILYANLELILFLVAMMIIVAFLEERGVFSWFVTFIIRPFSDSPYLLIGILLMIGALMAALVDEVTSILFMSAIMLKILDGYGITGKNTLPYIMFLVFTTNIGSSALPVGNPIGVMIAFAAGFSFMDFIRWTVPIAIICSLVTVIIGLAYLKRTSSVSMVPSDSVSYLKIKLEETPMTREVMGGILIFVLVIGGLIMLNPVEQLLSLEKNILLLGFPLMMAGIVLVIDRQHARMHIEKVDWYTLLFFLFLFAGVGSLSYVGITSKIASLIIGTSGDVLGIMLLVGGMISLLTPFIDNVLAVAMFIPIVQTLYGIIPLAPVWWSMLIGGTYCGNATLIGSTANVVAAGMVEKKGLGSFSMLGWMKIGIPITLLTVGIAYLLLYIQVIMFPF
jgi:Na+/H+ antiporter NhaD/arsenite permease-like protein